MVTPALRRRLIGLLLAVAAVLGLAPAHAADAQIQLDATDLVEGQRTGFDVVVEGARPRTVPEVPAESGLTVAYVGQSQTTSIVNGKMQQYVKFRFEVVARKVGTWKLGPAWLKAADTAGNLATLTTQPVRLSVAAGDAAKALPEGIDVTTAFDTKEAWQGQVVLYQETLRSRKPLASAGWYGQPAADLQALKDARPEHREYVVRDARGDVLVNETITPWVVTGTGSLTWPAPALEVDVVTGNGFGLLRRTTSETVPGQRLALEVKPLPPPPPGFTGLVGDFTIVARIERSRAKVGESIDWTVALEGDGSLDGFDLPPPKDIDGVRTYASATHSHARVKQGKYLAGQAFERTLVPTRPGTFELPATTVVAFSPTAGDYVTLTTKAMTLTVAEGEGNAVDVQSFGTEPPSADAAPEEVDGPRPLVREGPGLRLPWTDVMPLVLGVVAVPALALWLQALGTAVLAFVRSRQRTEVRVASPLERLAHLPDDPEARLVALDAALRVALAQVDGVDVGALDRAGALARLDSDVAGEAGLVSRALDRARFAGVAPPPDLEERLRAVVTALAEERR